jgi:hypothetical protein
MSIPVVADFSAGCRRVDPDGHTAVRPASLAAGAILLQPAVVCHTMDLWQTKVRHH